MVHHVVLWAFFLLSFQRLCNGNTCQSYSLEDFFKFKQWIFFFFSNEIYVKHFSYLEKHAEIIVLAAFYKRPFFCNVCV